MDVTHGSAVIGGLHEGDLPEEEEREGHDGGFTRGKEVGYDDGVLEMEGPNSNGHSGTLSEQFHVQILHVT